MRPGPPPFPRTPLLWAPESGAGSDLVVARREVRGWLREPVLVEEKLDGANISIWLEDGRPRVAGRGGIDAMDRGRQLGPLKGWVAEALDRVAQVCEGGWVLYGEWMWLRHTVSYNRLPDFLVGLDLFHRDHGFADHGSRASRLDQAGLIRPPVLFEGILRGAEELVDLMGRSRFGEDAMEGVVLRRRDRDRCKVLRPGFRRAGDRFLATERNERTA